MVTVAAFYAFVTVGSSANFSVATTFRTTYAFAACKTLAAVVAQSSVTCGLSTRMTVTITADKTLLALRAFFTKASGRSAAAAAGARVTTAIAALQARTASGA